MSSQQPRRSARVSRDNRVDLIWIVGFFVVAVIGGILAHQLLLGHAATSWPVTFAVALVVAVALGVVLRTGALDERPSASGPGGNRADAGSPAHPAGDGGSPRGHRSPAGPPKHAIDQTGGQPLLSPPRSPADRRAATGPQVVAPGARNAPRDWWDVQAARESPGPGAASPTVPVLDPGMAGTVTIVDPTRKNQPPGTSRSASSPEAEAVIAQCPGCGSFRMDGSVRSGNWQFTCPECQHQWDWTPGRPWPEVQVRPDHRRRGTGPGRGSKHRAF